jgi:hypothetical protein
MEIVEHHTKFIWVLCKILILLYSPRSPIYFNRNSSNTFDTFMFDIHEDEHAACTDNLICSNYNLFTKEINPYK